MMSSRGLRWSGIGISNGRQRLLYSPPTTRNFSLHATTQPSPRYHRHFQISEASRISQLNHYRSISLFGWGSSSKPSGDEFAEARSPEASPPASGVETWDLKPATLSPARTVKASHSTSDFPEPSSLPQPYSPEPQILPDPQNPIEAPSDPAATTTNDADLTAVPEYVGYLKEVCGLDYGWGTSAVLQNVLEHIHIDLGLSWALAIPALAVFVNLVGFYPSLKAADASARMRAANYLIKPLRKQMTDAAAVQDLAKVAQSRMELKAINKEWGISLWKVFIPILVQIPLQFGAFRGIRGMATVPAPALEVEPWLWTTDLTLGDPYYILPFLSGAMLYLNFKISFANNTDTSMTNIQKMLTTFLPVFTVAFMSFQPGAVQLFFLTSSAIVVVRTMAINVPFLRALMGVYPQQPKAVFGEAPTPSPGGLVRARPTPGQSVEIESPSQNRSSIDRAIDSVKAQGKSFASAYKGVKTQVVGEADVKRKKALIERAEEFEARRRQQLESEKVERNRDRFGVGGWSKADQQKGGSDVFESDDVTGPRRASGTSGEKKKGQGKKSKRRN